MDAIATPLATGRTGRGDWPGRLAWARKLRGSRIVRSIRLRAHVEDRLAMLSRVRKRSGGSFSRRRVSGAELVPAKAGIAGRMELEEVEHRVSAESIYRHVYSPIGRRTGLPRQLAQRKATRGRRRRNGRRAPSIPNRVSIHQRPTKAHLRSQFGHWEGDLVHFRRQRDILLTLQERKTRLTLARRLQSKDAELTASAIAAELGGLPAKARRTITHDNGGEFARHAAVTAAIGRRAFGAALGPVALAPHSAIPIARGSAAGSKTPMACSRETCQERPASTATPKTTSMM